MTDRKPNILFLDTVYKFDMEAIYGQKLRLLSERFSGVVLTAGEVGDFHFGSFVVRSFPLLSSKLGTFRRAFFYGVKLARRMKAEKNPIDVIVTYDPLNTGLLGVLISRVCGIPLVVELNGDYTAWSNYADVPNPRRRAFKRWMYIKLAGFVLRRATGIKLLYSSQVKEQLGKLRSSKVVRVFPNCLDVSAFRNLGETQKAIIVGFPFIVKGIDIAVEAFKRISDKFPSWKLEVLGWYPGPEKELLDRCIDGHPRIYHHPPVKRPEMGEYIGKCGVVICASRTEGFPRVIKEAMQAGKPFVASRVGGIPDAVQHGVNGLLFDTEDVQGLASQLERLFADDHLRKSLGAAAQDYSEREYSLPAYLQHFSGLMLDVISSKK